MTQHGRMPWVWALRAARGSEFSPEMEGERLSQAPSQTTSARKSRPFGTPTACQVAADEDPMPLAKGIRFLSPALLSEHLGPEQGIISQHRHLWHCLSKT